MHEAVPGSRVTVSVYASSAKPGTKKLYDIAAIGNHADGVFMMAYDFAVAGSEVAMPTAPLYGKKEGIDAYKTGWDDVGKVSWRAYHIAETDTWRMLFLDDAKSLGMKYDYAMEKNLAGVGMWALGFDSGRSELWNVLRDKFGAKLTDSRVVNRTIVE